LWPDADENVAVAAIPMETAIIALPSPVFVQEAEYLPVAFNELDVVTDVLETTAYEQRAAAPENPVPVLKLDLRHRAESTEPKFTAAYRSLWRLAALTDLPRLQPSTSVVGIASTYNPYRDGAGEGGISTSSGEHYDPIAWTAAIQIDLRGQFGGVRFGRNYRAAFALVESGERQVIVKINDVGPLKPGRVIDLNERSMRYFDPFLQRGLLSDAKVTLLPGADWTPGPVGGFELASLASTQ
jgi:rare lipoprotein A